MQHEGPRQGVLTQESSAADPLIRAFDAELDYLFASLRRLGVRPEELEDLAHQVFLGLLRTKPKFDQRRSFQLHLFGLAVRALVRHRRRPGRNLVESAESLPLRLAVLDRVPLKHRAVLVLHELDQVSLEEIAGSLSMTRFGVAVRLRKARREMEAGVRQLAMDWRAGRFGHPDLLLAALGIRNKDFPENSAVRRGAGLEAATNQSPSAPSESVGEVLKLQDDIFLLEMVMDDFPETIYFKDRKSRFTHINRYAAAHYGIANPALAVGRTDFDFFTDEHASQALREEQEIIRTGRPLMSIEEQETLPNGKLRWVWTTKLPLHDRVGDVVGTFGLSRDIGERKAG
jgi:PAS domain S-box-containing protein